MAFNIEDIDIDGFEEFIKKNCGKQFKIVHSNESVISIERKYSHSNENLPVCDILQGEIALYGGEFKEIVSKIRGYLYKNYSCKLEITS